jgi:hypothetical protein
MATLFLEIAFWYHPNLSTLLSDSEARVAAIVSLSRCGIAYQFPFDHERPFALGTFVLMRPIRTLIEMRRFAAEIERHLSDDDIEEINSSSHAPSECQLRQPLCAIRALEPKLSLGRIKLHRPNAEPSLCYFRANFVNVTRAFPEAPWRP